MAILVLGLAALVGHEGIAIQMSDYSNRLSQATLLAEGKLLDLEHKLLEDESTMDDLDSCDEGSFDEEGFDKFKWKACAYKLEVPEGATDAIGERFMSMMTGLDTGALGIDPAQAEGLAGGALAGNVGMAVGAIPMFLQQLEDKIRKVRLEVAWKDVVGERTVVLERFVTVLGQDRRGGAPPPPPDPDGPDGIPNSGDEPPPNPLGDDGVANTGDEEGGVRGFNPRGNNPLNGLKLPGAGGIK